MKIQSEQAFLDIIDRYFPTVSETVALGRGDDACIITTDSRLCISSDTFLDSVHFRHDYFSPADIGHKALAVNLSDMAAMGARPLAFLLNLMVPPELDRKFFEPFFQAMAALAAEYGVVLAGGDLTRAQRLGVDITIWGSPGPSGRLLTRGGCAPGDLLFTVGRLGLARAGFSLLEERGPKAVRDYPTAVAAHLRPQPLVREGLILAGLDGVLGLMDVSDGLGMDLPRFLALGEGQNLGADLRPDTSLLHPELLRFTGADGAASEKAMETALLGGEDYGLLGAARPDSLRALQASLPGLAVLGTVTPGPDILLHGRPWRSTGFDHFSKPNE